MRLAILDPIYCADPECTGLRCSFGFFGFTNLTGSLDERTLRALDSLYLVNQGIQDDSHKVRLRVSPSSPVENDSRTAS